MFDFSGAKRGAMAGASIPIPGIGTGVGALAGGVLGGLLGGGDKLDPNAMNDLRNLNMSQFEMPGADELFENIDRSLMALNPVVSAEVANLSRGIQAREGAARRGATAGGGTLGQRAGGIGADALAAGMGQAAASGRSSAISMGQQATQQEASAAQTKAQWHAQEVASHNQNKMAQLNWQLQNMEPSAFDEMMSAAMGVSGVMQGNAAEEKSAEQMRALMEHLGVMDSIPDHHATEVDNYGLGDLASSLGEGMKDLASRFFGKYF